MAREKARERLLHVVRRDPKQFGIEGTRWTLDGIHRVCDWLRISSPAGISALLERLQISYQRARDHVHSPDPDYPAKLAAIAQWVDGARHGDVVTLYLDELTYYRQPSLAPAYEAQGGRYQPRAERSHRANTATRVVATQDVRDGRVVHLQASRIGVKELVRFYQQVQATYPQARRIYVVQDNWPVHYHPDLLLALEAQETQWPMRTPPTWSTAPSAHAQRQWGQLQLPIQLVPLPTYASWANPIEKLWRWLKQHVLHLHRLADHLDQLRAEVTTFLDKFRDGSQDLLRYTGLLWSG